MEQEEITIPKKKYKTLLEKAQKFDLIQNSKEETKVWDKLSDEALENFENSY
jgi:hypothetical protein